MNIPFHKYQGAGNDFILIPRATPEPFPSHVVATLCDRHFGIGADGLLLVCPTADHDAQMIVQNADGTRPEMCGNGLRCAALHVASIRSSRGSSTPVSILTDCGPRACLVEQDCEQSNAQVTVDMGHYTQPEAQTLLIRGMPYPLHIVSVGNPHAICFELIDDATFTEVAPQIATHPSFPAGINATFATVVDSESLRLRVWERGVGPTLACGTAACAATAAAVAAGMVDPGRAILAHLPGGTLSIAMAASRFSVQMTGPADRVFDGFITHASVGERNATTRARS